MKKLIRLLPALLILGLISGCAFADQPEPTSHPADESINVTADASNPLTPITRLSDLTDLPATTITAEQLIAADPDHPTYYYAPLHIKTQANNQLSETEYLVDEYPQPPVRHIYVLAPDHTYTICLDLTGYSERPEAVFTDVKITYSNSLSDADIGVIEVIFTETYPDQSQNVFCGQIMFVADCPKGINLGKAEQIFTDPSINGCLFTLDCARGQISNTLYAIHAKDSQQKITVFGHPLNVVSPEEADTETYMWPNTEPSHTPPDFVYYWSDDFELYWPDSGSSYVTSTYRSTD